MRLVGFYIVGRDLVKLPALEEGTQGLGNITLVAGIQNLDLPLFQYRVKASSTLNRASAADRPVASFPSLALVIKSFSFCPASLQSLVWRLCRTR
jgi:hypothetical protein